MMRLGWRLLGNVSLITFSSLASTKCEQISSQAGDTEDSCHDQGSFQGRYFHFVRLIDPRLLLWTKTEILQKRDALMRNERSQAEESNMRLSNDELQEATRVCDSAIHPDSGKVIPVPFRCRVKKTQK